MHRVKPDGTVYVRTFWHVLWTTTNFLQLSDEWADEQIKVAGAGDIPETTGCLNSFSILKKKYTKLRVVVSVGGGGKGSEPFAAVARDPACRETFARTALELVQRFGIDGIDSEFHKHISTQLPDIFQSIGSIHQTLSRDKTILHCFLLFAIICLHPSTP